MANKGKFFSWFGKSKNKQEAQTDTVAADTPATTAEQSEHTQTAESAQTQTIETPAVQTPEIETAIADTQPVTAETPVAEEATPPTIETEPAAPIVEPEAPAVQSEKPVVQNEEQAVQSEEPAAVPKPGVKEKEGFFARFKKDTAEPEVKLESKSELKSDPETSTSSEANKPTEKESFFARLKKGLSKTKTNLGSGLVSLFKGKKIDDELFEELETQLLVADVGVDTTLKLVASLTKQADRKQLKDGEALYDLLKHEMTEILAGVDQPLVPDNPDGPFVLLMVGVNGVGKTTTIGKMAKQFQSQGKSVMLAAGDTFRAAAVEQLTVWGERNNIPVIAQHTGADSASVIFDAIQAAKARNIDVIIADTAGRLQNKEHLMDELKKVVRVMKKLDVAAPHEVMLTLDAGTGQNALSQVKLFSEAVGLTGLTISKLDGTAKGGVVFAIADQFSVPIRYIGVGEGIDDLRAFNSKDFVDALFSQNDHEATP